ncbi:MAG: hypothetical protein IKG14_03515 [Clostridia bacterium]|nr:hypothetical protein [Clostridia bacterium]
MNKKKILWIVLLTIVIAGIGIGIFALNQNKENKTSENNSTNETNDNTKSENTVKNVEYQKIELDDGILYSVDGEKYNADMVIGDNYFDTTISDMYINPEDYYGSKIQIEGMYLTDGSYTSVGRYSTSSLCAFCPAGYSFIEYQLDGTIDKELEAEKDWIKIIGTLEKANDETSFYQDYFYIKALNIEIMNEKGNDTVNN